jgi:hypothetical protein
MNQETNKIAKMYFCETPMSLIEFIPLTGYAFRYIPFLLVDCFLITPLYFEVILYVAFFFSHSACSHCFNRQ